MCSLLCSSRLRKKKMTTIGPIAYFFMQIYDLGSDFVVVWFFADQKQFDLCLTGICFLCLPSILTSIFIIHAFTLQRQYCHAICSCIFLPILCFIQPFVLLCRSCPCKQCSLVWCFCCNETEHCICKQVNRNDPDFFDVIFRFFSRLFQDIPFIILNTIYSIRVEEWPSSNAIIIGSIISGLYMICSACSTIQSDFIILRKYCQGNNFNNNEYEYEEL